jgi:hypothetical protein
MLPKYNISARQRHLFDRPKKYLNVASSFIGKRIRKVRKSVMAPSQIHNQGDTAKADATIRQLVNTISPTTPFSQLEGRLKVIYRITYPNGKIYIGHDRVASMRYFGSPNRKTLAEDFTLEDYRDFTVRREIIWESETATRKELIAKEVELIREFRSNDPAIGYNRWPKFRSHSL